MTAPQEGRDLDAIIAERLLRLGVPESLADYPAFAPYSTDIAAAWTLVGYLYGHGMRVTLSNDHATEYLAWMAQVHNPQGQCIGFDDAPTMPLALCRAVLAACA